MIIRSALVIAASVLAAAGVATARASSSAGMAAPEVRVTAKDFSFVLSRKSVPHGRVEFVIKDAGKTSHNFEIAGHTSKTIQPGTTTTMYVRLKAGRYPYKCAVDSHANLGMKGTLRVT
jgi:plastocyanin